MASLPCMTSSTHLFIALAAACFSYIFLILPATTKLQKNPLLLIYITFFIYCVVFPIMTIYSGAIKTSVSGDDDFILVKFLSIIGFLVVFLYFAVHPRAQYARIKQYHVMSLVFMLMLALNIFEAVVSQGLKSNITTFDGKINTINTIAGIFLLLSVFLSIPTTLMSIKSTESKLQLVSGLTLRFIVAYTVWNLLFRIQLVENSSIMLFTCVSLIVPIICHVTGRGDWLQTRGLTLLLAMLLTMGLGTGQANIFPGYNETGRNITSDNSDIATQVFSNDIFRAILAAMSLLFVLYSFRR